MVSLVLALSAELVGVLFTYLRQIKTPIRAMIFLCSLCWINET